MSKHFRSILRLVSDDGVAPATQGGERLSIGSNSSPKTVTFPEQPRPPFAEAPTEYSFDGVFAEKQSSVYKDSVRQIVDNVLAGYNGTVISMATQAAHLVRTETMNAPKRGAILKASQQIFRRLMKSRKKQAQACSNLVVLCTLVVVINESVHDLLAGFSSAGSNHKMSQEDTAIPPKLSLPEEGSLVGASQQEVQGTVKMASLLQYGMDMEKKILEAYRNEGDRKTVHHTICTISVEYAQFGTMNAPISGSLSFVEVCPSDLLSCDVVTSKELVSLHTFVEMVNSLTQNGPTTLSADFSTELTFEKSPETLDLCKKSVLTQLLKEALGGNCKTLLLTFTKKQFPAENYSKIRSVLELASRARLIQNSPNRKDIAEKALMNAYMRELHDMYGDGGSAAEGDKKIVLKPKPIAKSPTNLSENGKDERQHNMEMAAFALVTAIEGGGEVGTDSDSCSDDDLDSLSKSVQQKCTGSTRPRSTKVKIRRRKTKTEVDSAESLSASGCDDDIGVDALITILQDPDNGAPRPSVAALDNVKLRPDAGAIFSGAAIVRWLMESVAGVETEEQAVCLGDLLLTRGALVHSEGSMVFANAESLFYYAKEGRPNRRTLSQQEIQSLLAQAQAAMATEVTAGERSHDRGNKERLHNIHQVDMDSSRDLQSQINLKSTTPNVHEIYNCVEGETGEVLNTSTIESVQSINSETSLSSSYPITSLSSFQTTPPSSSWSVSGSAGEVSSLLCSADGAVEGLTPPGGRKSVRFQDDKSVSVDEETTSDPYTAPVECLPTVHTLENTLNYPHPLHGAVAIGKKPGVVRELVMMFGINKEDDHKRTPLMFAALGNNKRSSVSTLIECGADLNRQDVSGLTALHVACYHGNKTAAKVLLSKKAVIEILDAKGHSAFHWSMVPETHSCLQLLLRVIRHASPSILREADSGGLTALHWAIHFKRPHHLALLLKKYGDPVHLDKEGRSLVTYALQKESLDCMKVLISAHPTLLTFPDITQSTPFHHASAHPSPHPLLYLLSHESTPLLINATNSYQRTPLHCAVAYNSVYNTDLLLRRGADVQLCDNEGKTPLDYAHELENGEDMLAILEGHASFEWTDVESSRPHEQNDLAPGSRFCTVS